MNTLKSIGLVAVSTMLTFVSPLTASLANAFTVNNIPVGKVKEDILEVDEHCSWNNSTSGEAIYSTSDNEAIVGYEKITSSKWEGSGYDIDKTPPNYNFESYSQTISKYKGLIDSAVTIKNLEFKGRTEQQLNTLREALSKLRISHSTFKIDWRCKGSGNPFDQKRGKVFVQYKVFVMSIPSPGAMESYLENLSKELNLSSNLAPQVTSRNKWNDSIDIPIIQLDNPTSFDGRFRAVNDWAGKNGYGGGYPNFHQADYGKGVVYGAILLKKGAVKTKDIPASELGNPANNEARFRAVNDWAGKNGYAGGFPNFHQANHGQGVVYGTILFKKGVAEVRDIPATQLDNPQTPEERFRAVNDWAGKNGYAGGFPNFHQADHGQGVVYGTVLIKK